MKKHTAVWLVTVACLALWGAPAASGVEKKTGVAGDIAADPDGTETFTNQSQTAQLVADFNPVKFFLTGDTQYADGDPGDYDCALSGETEGNDCGSFDNNENTGGQAWGTLDDADTSLVEAVGNHEYFKDSNAGQNDCCDSAPGFRTYFNREASETGHGPTGWDNALYYYTTVNTGATDDADWRIYVIDSMVCDQDLSECQNNDSDPTSQYEQLQADILNDPYRTDPDGAGSLEARDCVAAIWHHSRFSNEDSHGDESSMRDIYDLLDDYAGADLILAGHSHNYEKFPRQDADGNLGSNAPRPFIVGTGGTSTRGFDIDQNVDDVWDHHSTGYTSLTTTRADAQVQDNGILKIWMRPSQFDTQFVEEDNGTRLDPDSLDVDALGQGGTAWDYSCSNDPST
jgi:hypothetical protein